MAWMDVFAQILFTLAMVQRTNGAIFQSSEINGVGAVNFTLQVGASQSECALLLARGDMEFIDTILMFNPNGVSYASAYDMFILVKELDENSNVINCFQFGGFDYETSGCGIVGTWPNDWGRNAGTYLSLANVTTAKASGESWSICVGNGWTSATGAVSYSGRLIFTSTLTYAIPETASPTNTPTLSPTTQSTAAPSVTPTLAPSSIPTATFYPTINPTIQIDSNCGDSLSISFDAQLSGGESLCIDFGANGALNSFPLTLNFSGSVTGEKASDFGTILYSTHNHQGVQYGGYDYFLNDVTFMTGWPESWNSRTAGTYFVDQTVTITPSFDYDGDYYRFCIFNGWSLAQRVTYTGQIDLGHSLSLNCDVIPPDLTPTLTPSSQPTVTLAPTGIEERGIYPRYTESQYPLAFTYELNLLSSKFVCSPLVESTGTLTSLSTIFEFSTDNDISWASDMLLSVRYSTSTGEKCFVIGGEDVTSEQTCATPVGAYPWPETLESNHDGNYNATIIPTGWESSSGFYEVCITNGFAYEDGSTVTYRGVVTLIGLVIPYPPTTAPTPAPSLSDNQSQSGDDDNPKISFKAVLLMSILIPVGVGVILFLIYIVVRVVRKKSAMSDTLIDPNTA